MSYTIRNIRPSVLHIPDAGLRLDSGQTAVVVSLTPQMETLVTERALEAFSRDPTPPAPAVTVQNKPATEEKKSGKTDATSKPEAGNDPR